MTADPKRSHAYLDIEHRRRKARKVIEILGAATDLGGKRVLEVGCGAGVIAAEIGDAAGREGQTIAVDLVDERVLTEGFSFTLSDATALPFPDGHFDAVISNHVLEHVGDRPAQIRHLAEIARVLVEGGVAYLAVPNRWTLREPHYGLWLLSWPPRWVSDRYLRVMGAGECYDCLPPGPVCVRRLIAAAGLTCRGATAEALRWTLEIEGRPGLAHLTQRMPRALLTALEPLMPTLILLLEPRRRPG